MAAISHLLVTFILNALWQIPAITAIALVCTQLLRNMPSRYAHVVWTLALTACLLVPATTLLLHRGEDGSTHRLSYTDQFDGPAKPGTGGIPVSWHLLSRPVSFPPNMINGLLWAYSGLLLFRAMRLIWLAYQTWGIRNRAYRRQLSPALHEVVERCARSFLLPGIYALCSSELSGPSTIGIGRPVLLLPESFYIDELAEDDMFSAVAHELAHVRRHDFFFNLLYELAYLPLSFHPCAAMIMSRIAQTRELACDEIAARMLPTVGQYARSLLHIAQSIVADDRSRLNYALGLFDTNTLEERIMNILKTNNGDGTKTLVPRLMVVGLVGLVSLGLSAFSLRLNNTHNPSDLEQFAGTWEAKYQGTVFFTLQLKLTDGSLGGTCIHNDRMALVDGELIPTGNKFSTEKILETSGSGKKLVMKIGDTNSSNGFPLEFIVTAPGQAEAKIIAPSDSGAPPQKKPWHLQRVGQ